MSSCPGLLSPQECNKGGLGWFMLISAIFPLTFPERWFFLVQLLLSFLAISVPHWGILGGNLGSLPHKVYTDRPIYMAWILRILSIHMTAAFPWNLYQVVMGSEPKDSGSSFLFWHVHALPAQSWAFLNCQVWCFPKGLAGPVAEPEGTPWEFPAYLSGSVVVVVVV